jgi:hypothetical protein
VRKALLYILCTVYDAPDVSVKLQTTQESFNKPQTGCQTDDLFGEAREDVVATAV